MLDGLAHDLLGLAFGVRLGAVEEVYSGIPGSFHAGIRVLCVFAFSTRLPTLLE